FLLLCISRLNSGTDVASPELQKTMTITAAEYFDSFPDMGRKNKTMLCVLLAFIPVDEHRRT
ncbi:hypothetical protein NW781_26700, partial [Escherichia coli]|nr:hypothetical protein [Escherichia coli]